MEFGSELFAEIEDNCALNTTFFSHINMKDNTQNYS